MYLRSHLPDLPRVPPVLLRGVPTGEGIRAVRTLSSLLDGWGLDSSGSFAGALLLRRTLVQQLLPQERASAE